jgi:hypothetical protein
MNKFDKVYKNYDPSTKKLASLNSKQIEQIDLLVDYISSHLPSYETKQEQKAIFETLIEEIEDVMSIYQDGW